MSQEKRKRKKKSHLRAKLIKNNDNGPFKFKGHLVIKLTTCIAPILCEFGAKTLFKGGPSLSKVEGEIQITASTDVLFFFLKIKLD